MNDKQKLDVLMVHRQYISAENQLNLLRIQLDSICGNILKENNCPPDEYVNVDKLSIEKRPAANQAS